jgi:hypothetical protein
MEQYQSILCKAGGKELTLRGKDTIGANTLPPQALKAKWVLANNTCPAHTKSWQYVPGYINRLKETDPTGLYEVSVSVSASMSSWIWAVSAPPSYVSPPNARYIT